MIYSLSFSLQGLEFKNLLSDEKEWTIKIGRQ